MSSSSLPFFQVLVITSIIWTNPPKKSCSRFLAGVFAIRARTNYFVATPLDIRSSFAAVVVACI